MQRLRHGAPFLVTAVLLAACSTPSAAPTVSPPASVAPSATARSSSSPAPATPAPSVSATLAPVAAEPPPLAVEPVVDGLAAPISISAAPGAWLLVNEQAGRVVAVHPDRNERATTLDISDRVLGEGERGLLGLALHPDWPAQPRAFVHYSDRDGNTVVSELSGSQDGDAAPVLDPATERVLLQVQQPFANHNGGQLAFGPDGHLWLGLGDGGSGGDPQGHGQDASTLLGSILRLDVSEPGTYAIPADNPFASGGGAPEIYLVGLRNPWRFSFDSATGALWVADVGQNAYEEINRLDPAASAGANLGWNRMEATHCFAAGCSADGLVLPLAEYDHDLGCSVTGGHVYRGREIDGLAGWYLFADYCSGLLFGVPSDAEAPTDGTALAPRVLLEIGAPISTFGQADDGELYLASIGDGVLYRITGGG